VTLLTLDMFDGVDPEAEADNIVWGTF